MIDVIGRSTKKVVILSIAYYSGTGIKLAVPIKQFLITIFTCSAFELAEIDKATKRHHYHRKKIPALAGITRIILLFFLYKAGLSIGLRFIFIESLLPNAGIYVQL